MSEKKETTKEITIVIPLAVEPRKWYSRCSDCDWTSDCVDGYPPLTCQVCSGMCYLLPCGSEVQ